MNAKSFLPAFFLATLPVPAARADLLVQTGRPGYERPTIARFSDNGTLLANLHTDQVDESVDELLAAPDGAIY